MPVSRWETAPRNAPTQTRSSVTPLDLGSRRVPLATRRLPDLVEAQDREEQDHAGYAHEERIGLEVGLAGGDHVAPGRLGARDAQSEVAQRGLGHDQHRD